MNKTLFAFFIFIAIPNVTVAQKSIGQILNGKVVSFTNDLEGVNVVNLNTEKSTTTDNNGYFSITATVCDTLVFSSIQFKKFKLQVGEEDLSKSIILVRLTPSINQLKEVMVFQNKTINAVSLGIIPKGQKKYTPVERKLATASSSRFNPMGLDPILNLFSGRTAMLKKELEAEKKELLLRQIEEMFDKQFFITNLKIPEEYLEGFQHYILENTSFVSVLESKNKSLASFVMAELGIKYNKIIRDEKEN